MEETSVWLFLAVGPATPLLLLLLRDRGSPAVSAGGLMGWHDRLWRWRLWRWRRKRQGPKLEEKTEEDNMRV